MSKLQGKVALVTGGSRGIGREIARQLARDGAQVVISYQRAAEAADALVAELAALGSTGHAVQADQADPASGRALVEATLARFGRIDIVVANAGVFQVQPVDADPADLAPLAHQQAVNIDGVAQLVRAAARHLGEGVASSRSVR